MFRVLLIIGFCTMLSGCITKVSVQAAYPFEKRYSSNTSIKIDEQKIDIPKGRSVWILSDSTLNNLLLNAKGGH